MIICLAGIDGSGKTTQAKSVVDWLRGQGIDAVYVWNRWEPRLLSLPGRLLRRRRGGKGPDTDRDATVGSKQRILSNRFLASVWLTAAQCEYARQARRRFARAPSGSVIVCDRYLPDFVVDQAMNLGGPAEVGRVARCTTTGSRFLQPVSTLVIDADPEACLARKWDGLPLERLRERRDAYLALADAMSNVVVVDGRGDERAVAERVRVALMKIIEEAAR
jgi:thymidylate kinase